MVIWEGFLFGMLLQLSVGPVCLAVWRRSLMHGMREAIWMVWGVACADAIYMLAAIGGLTALLQIAWVHTLVLIAGGVTLIWFGISSFRAKPEVELQDQGHPARGEASQGSFWYGIGLTLTNPLTIVFWAGVFSSIMASQALADHLSLAGFAVGCIAATVFFLTMVAMFGRWLSGILRPLWIRRLDQLVGVLLIGFALLLLQKGLIG
ncbi:LysE family translocator [Brevibacillus panacihumi]|uniref:LysE family translocator n=1 Tax=Brevibacillus panacihumi TaxID=497735 RepID=A0A3M8D0C8_9BACL|nr:LysE family translocator [Brevibacillus panacihumi]RNB81524.1 LysE family translocator [Brevibacillus panacihumi]